MRIYRQKSIRESKAEWMQRQINLPKCGCSFTQNGTISSVCVCRLVIMPQAWSDLIELYLKESFYNWKRLLVFVFQAIFCSFAMHQEHNVHMARCCFGTGRQMWLCLAEIVQRIESPMAFWLGTVIEKGQLAYSRSGCELTGEIWSWRLPEEKGVLGERYSLAVDGQQHSFMV